MAEAFKLQKMENLFHTRSHANMLQCSTVVPSPGLGFCRAPAGPAAQAASHCSNLLLSISQHLQYRNLRESKESQQELEYSTTHHQPPKESGTLAYKHVQIRCLY